MEEKVVSEQVNHHTQDRIRLISWSPNPSLCKVHLFPILYREKSCYYKSDANPIHHAAKMRCVLRAKGSDAVNQSLSRVRCYSHCLISVAGTYVRLGKSIIKSWCNRCQLQPVITQTAILRRKQAYDRSATEFKTVDKNFGNVERKSIAHVIIHRVKTTTTPPQSAILKHYACALQRKCLRSAIIDCHRERSELLQACMLTLCAVE